MRIDKLEIQGYRSLYDVELVPAGLTVVVGPNNAGKSNLADSVDFLSDVHRLGLALAVQRRGGLENIAHRRKRRTRRSISFGVTLSMSQRETQIALRRGRSGNRELQWKWPLIVEHRFALTATSARAEADYEVNYEELTLSRRINGEEPEQLIHAVRSGSTVQVVTPANLGKEVSSILDPLEDQAFIAALSQRVNPGELLMRQLQINDLIWSVSSVIGRARVYRLIPDACRAPGAPTPNPELERNGGNLPAVVWDMTRRNSHGWKQVLNAMKRIVPALEDITVISATNRRLVLLFHESGVGRPWTADEVSDGTIHSLALFVTLRDRRTPFTVIEEPENSVHPWVLRVFMEECRKATAEKQIVITTHSPVVLSNVQPPEVMVMWRNAGRSAISPLIVLDSSVQERWREGLGTVYDFLDSGYVPEAVPAGLDQQQLEAHG